MFLNYWIKISSLLALICICFFLITSLASAQGTGNIWITDINNQNQVIEGYRHNVDIEGTEIFIDGAYDQLDNILQIQVYVNSVLTFCSSCGAGNGFFNVQFTVPAPCQKIVVEIRLDNAFQPDQWTEPIEIFITSGSNNTCTPECDDCNKASSGQGAGFPVDVVNGKMYYSTTDLALSGPNGLRFERYYDNQSTYNQDLGYGWRHTYSHYLDLSNLNQIKYYDNHGRLITYGKNRLGQYDEDWFFGTKLTLSGGVYTVTTWDKILYKFNSTGKLINIIDRKGNTQTITYDTNNPPRISTVTDVFGKTLTLAYSGTGIRIQSITTDPGNKIISFSYDANSNLQNFTDPTGKIWIHEYQPGADHNLTGIKDPLNHYVETHTYANDKTLTSAKEGDQEKLTFEYLTGTTTRTTDTLGRQTMYTFDSNLKLVTQINGPACGCGGNQTRTFTWDDFLRKTSEKDGKDNKTTFTWFNKTISSQVYPVRNLQYLREAVIGVPPNETWLRQTEFTYYSDIPRQDLALTEKTASVDTTGQYRIITYNYDTAGKANLLSRQTDGYSNGIFQSFSETFTYDPIHGSILTYDGPRGDVNDTTTYSYFPDNDASKANRGQLNTITNALNQVTTYTGYDLYGNPATINDPNGVNTDFTYDNWGRSQDSKIRADGTYNFDILTQQRYQDDGLLDYVIHPEGNVTDFAYDAQHRQTEVQQKPSLAGSGDKIAYQYDTEGNKTHEEYQFYNGSSWVVKKFTDFAYDGYNRLWKIISPIDSSKFTENRYDAAGNLQYVDDSNHPYSGSNHQFTYSYDALNRLSAVTVLNGTNNELTQYGYDTDNNIISITDPEIHNTTENYDDFGRNIRTISPDSGTTTRLFDPAGNMTQETDARGIASNRTYDAINRISSVSYPNSAYNISYTYDSLSTPYGKGHLTQMTDQSGTTNYTAYERRGFLITQQKIITPTTYSTSYSYNKNGAITSMTYPSGRVVSYAINLTKGRPQTITARVSGTNTNLLSSINYMPFGPVSNATFSNGRILTRTFDPKYRMLTNVVSGSVLSLSYDYLNGSCIEQESNIRCINDTITPGNNKTFTYDDRYQVKNTTGPWVTENYTYDKNGNRITKGTNGNTTTYNYSVGTNRLSSTTGAEPANYSYDANGNITSDGSSSYSYGDTNRLSVLVLTVLYTYDAKNLRIRKTYISGPLDTPFPSWIYFYDQQGKLIAEKDELSGKFKDYIYLENEPMARIDNNGPNNDTLYIYHNDHIGLPIVLTNKVGAIVLSTQYFAFGKVYSQTGSASNNIRFLGQYFDSESNLHQNWYRDYDPKIGRYREVDPAMKDSMLEPRSVYSYALNDPLSFVDLNGSKAIRLPGGKVISLPGGKLCTSKKCRLNEMNRWFFYALPEDQFGKWGPVPDPGKCMQVEAICGDRGTLKIPDNWKCTINCNCKTGAPDTINCFPRYPGPRLQTFPPGQHPKEWGPCPAQGPKNTA